MENYPWYSSTSSDNSILLQGDLLPGCPILIPPVELKDDMEINVEQYNVVVMSQSCDLENGKVEFVLVCPYYTFSDYLTFLSEQERKSKKAVKKAFDNLRQGIQPNYHLLNKDIDKGIQDYLVVDFRNVYSVHIDFIKSFSAKLTTKITLLPPYREHLSQAFARFFMRVGLPQNIPPVDEDDYM